MNSLVKKKIGNMMFDESLCIIIHSESLYRQQHVTNRQSKG